MNEWEGEGPGGKPWRRGAETRGSNSSQPHASSEGRTVQTTSFGGVAPDAASSVTSDPGMRQSSDGHPDHYP